ncbi:extracellular solute-binding protein [Paenibacillus sp. PL2-23]|uniref:extracellular solute-binding protein n=1 Tax=Paenibacillus sp. PL2-23 TaxID=2100729 RepID=UPI0030F4EFF1
MKKGINLLLVVIFSIASIMGCSGGNTNSSGTSTNPTNTNPEATSKAEPVKEKLAISMVVPSYAGGGWPDNNHPTIKYLNEKFNIELDVQWIPGPNYNEKLNVLAASDNLPDIYRANPGSNLYEKWQGEGAFVELSSYIDNYPNLKNAFPEEYWKFLNPKDKIYGVPYGAPTNPTAFVVRKDWLDNVGLSVPNPDTFTIDEFYEIAKAFALKDPDQNGKNDTLGFSFGKFSGELPLRYAFGLSDGWMEIGGELVPYIVQEAEMKEYLTFLNKAYKEGVLDKDFPINEGQAINEKVSSGKLGLAIHIPIALLRNEAKVKEVQPNAEFVQLAPPIGPTGIQLNDSVELLDKVVLNGKMDQAKVERILEMMDWWVTDEGTDIIKNGPPNVFYKDNGDGTFTPTDEALSEGTRLAILNNWVFRRIANDHDVFKWDSQEYRERITSFFEMNEKYAAPLNPASGITFMSPTFAKKWTDLEKKYHQTVFKIIMGEAPLDSISGAIADWKKNGGDDIIKEINEAYQQMK